MPWWPRRTEIPLFLALDLAGAGFRRLSWLSTSLEGPICRGGYDIPAFVKPMTLRSVFRAAREIAVSAVRLELHESVLFVTDSSVGPLVNQAIEKALHERSNRVDVAVLTSPPERGTAGRITLQQWTGWWPVEVATLPTTTPISINSALDTRQCAAPTDTGSRLGTDLQPESPRFELASDGPLFRPQIQARQKNWWALGSR